jgi:streptogramin lyase
MKCTSKLALAAITLWPNVSLAQTVEFLSAHYQWPLCVRGFDAAGVEVARSQGAGQYSGVAFDPAGNWVATRAGSPTRVEIFAPNGALIRSFPTPQISISTDCAVFADGTIAVCDWSSSGSGTHLYSPLGVHLATLPTGPIWACNVDPLDRLWVCTYETWPSFAPSTLTCFSRNGTLITSFATTTRAVDFDFDPSGDLWLWGEEPLVSRWTSSGVLVSSFPIVTLGSKHGIARMPDGSLWVTHNDFLAQRYASDGTLLQSMMFPTSSGKLASRKTNNSVTTYCTAGTTTNGCVATISATGTPSASGVRAFDVTVSKVEGQRQGVVLYGVSGRNAAPWGASSSFLCINAPTQRTGAQASGGTGNACNGVLALDVDAYLAAHPSALGAPFAVGGKAWFQAWFRDPSSPQSSHLSNGLEVVFAP